MTQPFKSKYGLRWAESMTDLEIEFAMIHRGGKFTFKDKEVGKGLFHHYREAQSIMWPEDDHHRWSDLILKTILEERITVIQGSRDSSKTYTVSKYALTDYFAFPDITLILMSSTDIRGLELRVWGTVKDLFSRARERFPWLPGNVVDAKHGVFTDALGEEAEVRDMRKGIICIPCVGSSGEFFGISKYCGLKQKRRRLLGDECFPAGTLVDTPFGPRLIETIVPRDTVYCASGIGHVIAAKNQIVNQLVTVRCDDGRAITCTPNHRFLTQEGWVEAKQLTKQHYVFSINEAMSLLQSDVRNKQTASEEMLVVPKREKVLRGMRCGISSEGKEDSILQHILQSEMAAQQCGSQSKKKGFQNGMVENPTRIEGAYGETDARAFANVQSRNSREGKGASNRIRTQAGSAWRQWAWPDETGKDFDGYGSERDLELWCKNRMLERQRIPACLQIGHSTSEFETWHRSGWHNTQQSDSQGAGREEEQIPRGSWVDRVEIYKQTHQQSRIESGSAGGYRVYNIQVAEHPSYSVNGLTVHNCQFMQPAYMDSLSNLDKGDFKGAFSGNPLGQGDPLDKMGEPDKGWDSLGEITKTTTWKNKFQGITINLVGVDSPNFDEPRTSKPKYPYLITPDDVERVAARWGKDSVQYYSQIMGVRKPGLNAHRVITRDLCLKFGAFNDVIWSGKPTTKVYGIDASYGGDRCVGGYCEYGEDVNNIIVLKVHPPVIIPILVKSAEIPEDQIATFVRADCERSGIPPENVFYDSTGRGSLGTSFGRLWSSAVNPVEFGGNPTTRPVCHDLYILDDRTKERRLKRCDEHFSKRVSEYWFSVRYTVESRQLRSMPQDVLDEFTLREWTMVKGDKIEIETKEDTKARMGCSPDLADWLAICVEGARRLGFRIERLAAPDGLEKDTFWLSDELDKHKSFVRKNELAYQ